MLDFTIPPLNRSQMRRASGIDIASWENPLRKYPQLFSYTFAAFGSTSIPHYFYYFTPFHGGLVTKLLLQRSAVMIVDIYHTEYSCGYEKKTTS